LASKQFDKEQVAKSLELYQVLKDLRRENGFLTEEFQKQLDAVTDYLKEYEKVSKEVEKTTKRIKDQNKFLDDTEDILGSIADKVGKTSKLYKDSENYLKAQKVQLSSIADFTQQIGDEDFAKSAEKAVEAYKKYQKSVASVADRSVESAVMSANYVFSFEKLAQSCCAK
jgi:Asp-tRNA(Asn)/Glu-tRNA(Gln) amidotransferase C subunit